MERRYFHGIIQKFFHQFAKPEGFLGTIAGKLMASFGKEKHVWTLSLLNVQKDDYVLEIGFGPGVAIKLASKIVHEGKIVGIDYSEKMVQEAWKRNKKAIQNGKVELIHSDIHNLPNFPFQFDKVFTINSIFFWKQPVEALKNVYKNMKPDGIIAITLNPVQVGLTEEKLMEIGKQIAHQLQLAGFSQIKIDKKQIKPFFAICIRGMKKI